MLSDCVLNILCKSVEIKKLLFIFQNNAEFIFQKKQKILFEKKSCFSRV